MTKMFYAALRFFGFETRTMKYERYWRMSRQMMQNAPA